MKDFSLLLTTCFVFFLFPKIFIAWSATINEFVPNSTTEWIELFNDSDNAEYLKSYFIDDDTNFTNDAGSAAKKSLATLDTTNVNYPIFETNNFLNNPGDFVVIFSNDGIIIDQYQYTSDPGSGISIGRTPDGSGSFSVLSSTTKGSANSIPSSSPSPTESPTITVTVTSSPSPTTSKSLYKLNKPKDENGQILSGVKIYIDGQYTHHEDDELIEFCDNCFCDNTKNITCNFGEHTTKLSKSGYADWSEIRLFSSGSNHEITPILTKVVVSSSPTSTPNPTITSTPTKSPAPTPTKIITISPTRFFISTSSATFSGVLGESTDSASLSADMVVNIEITPTSENIINKPKNYKTPFFIGLFLAVSSSALLYFRHRKD